MVLATLRYVSHTVGIIAPFELLPIESCGFGRPAIPEEVAGTADGQFSATNVCQASVVQLDCGGFVKGDTSTGTIHEFAGSAVLGGVAASLVCSCSVFD